jgi:cell division protein FtsI/penicillin-binding protein 2
MRNRPRNRRHTTRKHRSLGLSLGTLAHKLRLAATGLIALTIGSLLCLALFPDVFDEDAGPGPVPLAVPYAEERSERKSVEPEPERIAGPARVVDVSELRPAEAAIHDSRLIQTLANGAEVTYTLNPALQLRATQILTRNDVPFGAVVALDPRTGRVLAMVDHRQGHPDGGGFALQSAQPAASIFKIITSAALMELKGIRPADRFCYHGGTQGISKALLQPNPKKDTSCRTFGEALGHSTNVIYARLADQHLTPDALEEWAGRFAFNTQLPFLWETGTSRVDLPRERLGFAQSAAGFHHSHMSPLHGAMIAAAIGNQGRMLRPRIVERVTQEDMVLYQMEPDTLRVAVGPDTARKLTSMLMKTTSEGTARRYFKKVDPILQGMAIAGKTGSLSSSTGGKRRHNSWFVGFAPAKDPEIAIAALVVNDPKWRIKATYLGRELLEEHFKSKAKNDVRLVRIRKESGKTR